MASKLFCCNYCKKVFNSKRSLKRHSQLHLGIHQCIFCNKSCTNNQCLFVHYRTHINEKPYWCEWCTKPFADNSALRMHLKRHSGNKSFLCSVCSKSFYTKSDLVEHQVRHGKNEGFKCEICRKKFFLQEYYKSAHENSSPNSHVHILRQGV